MSRLRLPNADRAVVPRAKIVDYLLSSTHPRGRMKAAFFVSFGFRRENWQELAAALVNHARTNDALAEDRQGAIFYTVDGALEVPRGEGPSVRSVWIIEEGADLPRLVTAHPLRRRR